MNSVFLFEMDVRDVPWICFPGVLILVSLILYGVDAPWMTPLYIAEMLMFFILGAERSDYSKSKPSAALLAVLIWIGGQLTLWMGWDTNLLWIFVILQAVLAYIYWFTAGLKVSARRKKIGYYDYSAIAVLLLIFFTLGRMAMSANLNEALWALGIFVILVADFFVEDIAATRIILYKKYSWVGYLAPLGALLSAYAAIAVAQPGLPLAII